MLDPNCGARRQPRAVEPWSASTAVGLQHRSEKSATGGGDDGRAVLDAGDAHDAECPGELVRADRTTAPPAVASSAGSTAPSLSFPAFITSSSSSTLRRPSRSTSARHGQLMQMHRPSGI